MLAEPPERAGERWLAAMRAGDWEAAWRQTDLLEAPRRRTGGMPQPHNLTWDGSPWQERSVLVRCEHGLGDTLQFLRFVPVIERAAHELHLMVQPPLVRLLQGAPGLGQVHDGWRGADTWPRCEVQIEVMELAYALRATPATVPPPYPLADRVPRLAEARLPATCRPRVALLWAASDWDPTRSLTLDALAPLLGVPGVEFFSLQQGPAAQDPRVAAAGVHVLSTRTQAIEAAAAAMLQMDLVVCVDGMPAHLAASLGVPTWLLLKQPADWRWRDHGTDTPWYPSMRLFRQRSPGDWAGVVSEVTLALRDWASSKANGLPNAEFAEQAQRSQGNE